MRFGISLISWIFPKIFRIRRAAMRPFLEVAGASLALVAICFPALCEPQVAPRSAYKSPAAAGTVVERCSRYPLQCVRSVRRSDPVPERTGKAPGARYRAARADMFG